MRYVLNDPLKECRKKRRTDKTRTKLTETTLITPISIHTNKTKHGNKVNRTYISFEAIVLKLIFRRYCVTLPAGFHTLGNRKWVLFCELQTVNLNFFIRCRSVAVQLTSCKFLSKSLGGKSFYSRKLVFHGQRF